jgi:hypothetical protein
LRWDIALLPCVRNEATRFILPTKTPEYLAAGRPVASMLAGVCCDRAWGVMQALIDEIVE